MPLLQMYLTCISDRRPSTERIQFESPVDLAGERKSGDFSRQRIGTHTSVRAKDEASTTTEGSLYPVNNEPSPNTNDLRSQLVVYTELEIHTNAKLLQVESSE